VNRRGALLPAVGLLLLLLVAGCRTSPPIDLQLAGTVLPIDDARAEFVLRNYLELVEARSALRGSARVLLEGPDFKLNRPQRILVERPARIRFEVIGLFDQLAAILATDGRRFDFYEASDGRVLRGRVTPALLWELAQIDLDIPEVVGLLLGAPRPSSGLARAAVWLQPDGGLVLVFAWPGNASDLKCTEDPAVSLLDADCFVSVDALDAGGEMFLFDVDGRLAEVRGLDPGGVIRFRATFEDYEPLDEDAGEVVFPNRVTIRSPGAESLARFDWKRVMLSDELSDRFFMIPERRPQNQDG
jgi:hypothetical protein